MRIAIDGIAVSHPQPGGYRTYATNLVSHLAQLHTKSHFVIFLDRSIAHDYGKGWQVEIISSRGGGMGVAYREQVAVPRNAKRFQADLLHSPCATGPLFPPVPLILTIHDLIELTEPLPSPTKTKSWAMRMYNRFVLTRVSCKAAAVITVSHHSKQQIVNRFGLDPARVIVTHEAAPLIFRPMERRYAFSRSGQLVGVRSYVLAFASAARHKNTLGLLTAYSHLKPSLRSRHPLVFACTHAGLRSKIGKQARSLGFEASLRFAERVPDDDLVALYNAAALFVFPSLREGFGLPPLEAMACGTPVVASNTSSMPEVLGDAALLVSPTDTRALADAMEAVLTDPALSAELVERGLERSRQFSWEDTARRTLAVYESVAGGNVP